MFQFMIKVWRYQKVIFILILCAVAITIYENNDVMYSGVVKIQYVQQYFKHNSIILQYYDKRKDWVTSNLGAVLFKNTRSQISQRNRTYTVLVWKYYDWLKNRHLFGFDKGRLDPLDECSVNNCFFTGNSSSLHSADAVIVHIQHGEIPSTEYRNTSQRWVFLSDESPKNSFSMASVTPNLTKWSNVFNWSMTYRSDADIPVPYGRTLPLDAPLMPNMLTGTFDEHVPHWKIKRRDVVVSVLMSNCGVSGRMNYLKELEKYIAVDVHGACSDKYKNSCPGHFRADCDVINEYLFYLVLENSKCRQYLTEKVFHNAYSKGAIPVIYGPPIDDCKKLLPPNSFLHIDNYKSPQELAKDMLRISGDNDSLLMYHQWRNNFKVVDEHGYFESRSFHYCRVCEALNYNDERTKTYDLQDLELFLNSKLLCH